MHIIPLLVMIALFGVALYFVKLIPMDPTVRQVLTAVAVIALVLWLLEAFGLLHGGPRWGW